MLVTVRWDPTPSNANADPNDDAVGYNVYWGPTQNSRQNKGTVPANVLTYSTDLGSGAWYLTVTAFNPSGESAASNTLVVVSPTVAVAVTSAPMDTIVLSDRIVYAVPSTLPKAGWRDGVDIALRLPSGVVTLLKNLSEEFSLSDAVINYLETEEEIPADAVVINAPGKTLQYIQDKKIPVNKIQLKTNPAAVVYFNGELWG